jgi:hypothetical protein
MAKSSLEFTDKCKSSSQSNATKELDVIMSSLCQWFTSKCHTHIAEIGANIVIAIELVSKESILSILDQLNTANIGVNTDIITAVIMATVVVDTITIN